MKMHEFVKKLTHAGVPEKQAESFLHVQTELVNDHTVSREEYEKGVREVKSHIAELDRKVDRNVDDINIKIEHKIEMLRKDLLLKLGGTIVVTATTATGIIIGVLQWILN